MTPSSGGAEARPHPQIMPLILQGRSWKARLTRNNNLRQHGHRLACCFKRGKFMDLKEVCAPLFRVLETRSRVFHDIHPKELPLVEAVLRLGIYQTCWLCAPEDWWPDENQCAQDQWADFLRHLMARYPVPAFMDSAWIARGTLRHFERHCWCALARGESLRSVDAFPKSISRRVLHLALASECDGSLPMAIWHAELDTQHVSPALFEAVMRSRVPNELWRHELWSRLVAKFSVGREEQAGEFETVANVLAYAGEEKGSQQVESLMRLSLPMLIRHSRKFVEDLSRSHGYTAPNTKLRKTHGFSAHDPKSWPPLLGSEFIYPQNSQGQALSPWRMEELCTAKALSEEGKVMEHCVAGYAQRCRLGTSAIFSLRKRTPLSPEEDDVISYVTLEISPERRKIVQMRAFKNRPVNSSCMNMILTWAKANHLGL